MSSSSFSLSVACEGDIDSLARISGFAFEADKQTRLKMIGKSPESGFVMMVEPLKSWMRKNATHSVLKITDNVDGAIMGWACWASSGYELSNSPNMEGNSIEKKEQAQAPSTAPKEVMEFDPYKEMDLIKRLESITNNDMIRWQKRIMPEGSKCLVMCAITVLPKYQSHGVGSALIQWGTKKADIDNVLCWVHASEAGYHAFRRHGFEEIERLELHLNEFASSPLDVVDGTKWGEYVFRYMVRPAVLGQGI
jgi:ribosomal protein S18 acetylase RimI-like enzyme